MATLFDERHWYQFTGWKSLRSTTMNLVMSYADDFLDRLAKDGCDAEKEIDAFVGAVIFALGAIVSGNVRDPGIRSRIGKRGDLASSMWPFALSLFGGIATLKRAIAKDVTILAGRPGEGDQKVAPRPALYQIVRRFLELSRQQQSPATLHRQSVWERIDLISRRLARENEGTHLAQRHSPSHIQLVQRVIKTERPSDKNLNMSLGSLYTYFDEFLDNFEELQHFEAGRNDNFDFGPGDGHQELMAIAEDSGFWPPVDLCLNKLKLARRELWEAFVVGNRLKDIDVSQQAYLAKTNITRYAFEGRSRDAAALLRKCLDDSVVVQIGRLS